MTHCPYCGTRTTLEFNPWTGIVYEEDGALHTLRRCVERADQKAPEGQAAESAKVEDVREIAERESAENP